MPPGPIQVEIVNYRASGGGFVAVALESIAGDAGIQSVELRASPAGVRKPHTASSTWIRTILQQAEST